MTREVNLSSRCDITEWLHTLVEQDQLPVLRSDFL